MRSAPFSRQVRGAVKINGTPLSGWINFEIENNGYYSADSFRVSLAGGRLPPNQGLQWFSQQQDIYVELFIGEPADPNSFTAGDLTSWIYGQVDSIVIDPFNNQVDLSGRDLTRALIDAKTFEKFSNKTSSDVAKLLAARHGLSAKVTPTGQLSAKYYESEHVNLNDERSEWDLLNYLAQIEGFIVYIRGQTLFFGPSQAGSIPYPLVWTPPGANGSPQCAVESIQFERSLTVSRGVQVVIRSWNAKQAKGFTVAYPGKAPKTINVGQSTVGNGIQVYRRTIRNLTQAEALKRAKALYDQIVQHEMKIEFMAPGDNDLTLDSLINLSGTGTAFDQSYYPDSVRRTMDFQNGYSMHVHAKNHAPQAQGST